MDWNELSMRERAAYIREGVALGLLNLNDIKNKYNVGGFTFGNSGGFNNAFSKHFGTILNLPTSKPVVVSGTKDKPKLTTSLRDYSVNFGNSNKGLKELFLGHLERYFQKHPNSEFNTPEWRLFVTNLVATESGYSYGSDNNLNADNRIGARGYFLLMPASRRKGNWSSLDELFEDAFNYLLNNLNYLRNNLSNADMEALRNQGIDIYGLMAAAHLGGAGGATKWARSRGRHNPSDGNTNLTSYAMTHTLMPHRWLDKKGKMQEGFNLWEPTDYYATYTPPQTGVSDEEVLLLVDQALSLLNNNPQYEKVEQPLQNLFAEFAHQQELDRRALLKLAIGILLSLSADNILSRPMIMPTESALYNDVFGSLFDSGGPIKKPTFMPEQDGLLNWPALQAVDVGYYPAQIDIPGGVETFVPNQYVGINPQDYEANRIIYREDGEPLLNPNYGHNSIVYKPEVNNNDSLALEGLHVMHEDPSYEAMFTDLKDLLLLDKSVLGDIMFNLLYELRDGESEKDAIEKTEKKINRFIKNLEENKLDEEEQGLLQAALDGYLRNEFAPDYLRDENVPYHYGPHYKVTPETRLLTDNIRTYMEGNVLPEIQVIPEQYAYGGNLFALGGSSLLGDEEVYRYLREKEGFLEHPTDIGDNKITIGSGLTDPKWVKLYHLKGDVWSEEDNKMAVKQEIAKRRKILSKIVPNWIRLPGASQDALTSYYYNYEFNRENSPKLFEAFDNFDILEIARQMDATSTNPKFRKGLQKRREEELAWLLSGFMENRPVSTPILQVRPSTSSKRDSTNGLRREIESHPIYGSVWSNMSKGDQDRIIDIANKRGIKDLFTFQGAVGPLLNSYMKLARTYGEGGYILVDDNEFAKGGKIHIKEKNKGKFSAAAKRAGMSTLAYASHVLANKSRYSPTLVKRANFARNASKWKHSYGGPLIYAGHQGYVRI